MRRTRWSKHGQCLPCLMPCRLYNGQLVSMQRVVHFSTAICSHHAALQTNWAQPFLSKHVRLSPRVQCPSRLQHRCMASYGGGGNGRRDKDPTLGEIGTELFSKAKQLPNAIYKGLSNLANKLLPNRQEPPPRQQRSAARSISEGMFGGGIMGKMMENTVGRVVENIAKDAAKQMQAAQQQAEQLQQSAAQAIEGSAQLKEYLGASLQVAEPISESSSMQSMNGQMRQTVELIMPVIGTNGRMAHAQVQSSGEGQLDIQVQLPNGRLIRIDPDEGAYDDDDNTDSPDQKGRVIDVDWREVR